jgi:hypothetical protein
MILHNYPVIEGIYGPAGSLYIPIVIRLSCWINLMIHSVLSRLILSMYLKN